MFEYWAVKHEQRKGMLPIADSVTIGVKWMLVYMPPQKKVPLALLRCRLCFVPRFDCVLQCSGVLIFNLGF